MILIISGVPPQPKQSQEPTNKESHGYNSGDKKIKKTPVEKRFCTPDSRISGYPGTYRYPGYPGRKNAGVVLRSEHDHGKRGVQF